ncbi:hypothetical protein [Mycobacterium sp. E2327]|uniref:hypothetical protein n=1 Tax=Mycobacterium sp. E2327 TaxID=1834132 RepID=UPI000AFA08FD|nr:hypothetical protein [Mycobacterium sp. E2327]
MNLRNQRICAWTGPALCVVFFLGFWAVAKWMPPPDPNAGPERIAEIYRQHTTAIRIGQIIGMTAIGFLVIWAAAIAAQMRRIEGPNPVLAYAQLALAAISCLVFIFPMFYWEVGAYRPERNPEQLWLLNDLGWLPFVMNVYTGVPWVLTIGWAILSDTRERPVFPRWAGYYCIWLAVIFLPANIAVFIKHGPFAWNGLVVFWLPITFFGTFLLVFSWLLLRAINDQANEERAAHPDEAIVGSP